MSRTVHQRGRSLRVAERRFDLPRWRTMPVARGAPRRPSTAPRPDLSQERAGSSRAAGSCQRARPEALQAQLLEQPAVAARKPHQRGARYRGLRRTRSSATPSSPRRTPRKSRHGCRRRSDAAAPAVRSLADNPLQPARDGAGRPPAGHGEEALNTSAHGERHDAEVSPVQLMPPCGAPCSGNGFAFQIFTPEARRPRQEAVDDAGRGLAAGRRVTAECQRRPLREPGVADTMRLSEEWRRSPLPAVRPVVGPTS
jgi:hypothetical protein